jgi:hypothetical protein
MRDDLFWLLKTIPEQIDEDEEVTDEDLKMAHEDELYERWRDE